MKVRVAVATIALAVAAVPAAAAIQPAKLTVKLVGKPPSSIQQGATFALAVRVANAKGHAAAPGRVP